MSPSPQQDTLSWRERWYEIIFEADTPAGKLFDVLLLVAILLSVLVVMVESVDSISPGQRRWLYGAEWFFTLLFTIEYGVRIACSRRPLRYIFSFYGIVDLLAIDWIGIIPEDNQVIISTNQGSPISLDGKSAVGEAFRNISRRMMGYDVPFIDLSKRGNVFKRY